MLRLSGTPRSSFGEWSLTLRGLSAVAAGCLLITSLAGCQYLGLAGTVGSEVTPGDQNGIETSATEPETASTTAGESTPNSQANQASNEATASAIEAGVGVDWTNQRALMIGTFNVQKFGESKLSKPEVMNRLRELAYPFDVLAIQEIVSQDVPVIQEFVKTLNQQFNANFNYVASPWLGDTSYKERYAFIFDASRVKLLEQPFVISDPENKVHREPLVARFSVRPAPGQTPFTFVLVNVHTDPDVAAVEMDQVSLWINFLEKLYEGQEDDILVLGDFNLDPQKIFSETQFAGRPEWQSVLDNTVTTNLSGNKSYDNILLRADRTGEYLRRSGVVDFATKFKLSEEEAKDISDHLPVWAGFSMRERAAEVATAAETTIR